MGVCVHLCTPVSRVTLVVCNTGENQRYCSGVRKAYSRVERLNIYSGCTKTCNSGMKARWRRVSAGSSGLCRLSTESVDLYPEWAESKVWNSHFFPSSMWHISFGFFFFSFYYLVPSTSSLPVFLLSLLLFMPNSFLYSSTFFLGKGLCGCYGGKTNKTSASCLMENSL